MNIIDYSGAGRIYVSCDFLEDEKTLRFEFVDDGKLYNPLAKLQTQIKSQKFSQESQRKTAKSFSQNALSVELFGHLRKSGFDAPTPSEYLLL